MNKRLFIALISIVLILSDSVLITRSIDLSLGYPFSKLVLGNKLHFPLVLNFNNKNTESYILEINGEPMDNGSEILDAICDAPSAEIYYLENGNLKHIKSSSELNVDLLSFMIIFIICGNIIAIWGAVIVYFFNSQYSARIFGHFTIAIGFSILAFIYFLLFQHSAILLIICSVFSSSTLLEVAILLSGRHRYERFLPFISIMLFISLLAASVTLGWETTVELCFELMVITLLLLVGINILRMKINPKISRNIMIVVTIGGFLSLFIPFFRILYSLQNPSVMPLHLFIPMSLLLPLMLASNITREDVVTSFSFRKRYFFWVILDFAVGIFYAISLYVYISRINGFTSGIIGGVIILTLLLALLEFRKYILDYIKSENPVYSDYFSSSIRRISEISASPGEFRDKIERIYRIIGETTGVRYFHIELFELSIVNKIEGIEGIITYSKGSALEKYILKNPSIINRHSFFSGSIFDILEIQNSMVELIVPVRSEDFIIGLMFAGGKENSLAISREEIIFFNSLSVVLYQMIENEILFKEHISKREFEREMDIASYTQIRLLPKTLPYQKGIAVSLYSRPYLKVTGDYYDFFEIDDYRTLVAAGDVAGHGLSAATILATVGNITGAMVYDGHNITEIMNELNHFFSARYRGIELMTLILMIYDNRDSSITYINAGHCPPVLYRDGIIIKNIFDARRPILGADRMNTFDSSSIFMNKNDNIIIYSDGLIEIQVDMHGNNIGEDILYDVINEHITEDIEKIIDAFSTRIDEFPKDAIKDDITVIGIKVE